MQRRRKGTGKLFCLALSLVACLALSGCALTGFDIQGLMSPPKANEDQQQIYELMKDENGNVDFYYPKTGEFRSAVTMRDLNGNGRQQAVGFSGAGDGGVFIHFFEKTGGVWSLISSHKNAASQVDRVLFGDLTGDGAQEVVVGWGSPQSMTAAFAVYSFQEEGGRVAEYADGYAYNEMILTDFNEDGVSEIFTADVCAQPGAGEQQGAGAFAKVYEMRGGKPIPVYSTKLNNSVEKYSAVSFDRMAGSKKVAVLDGLEADGSTVTQVVVMNESGTAIVSPLAAEELEASYNYFLRPPQVQVASRDMGEDGYLEIPHATLTPGHSANISQPSTAYLVDWVRFNPETGETVSALPTILNLEENYFVELPRWLKNHIVCFEGNGAREVTFYRAEYDGFSQISSSVKLFSVRAFTKSQWKEAAEALSDEYQLLREGQGDIVYGSRVYAPGAVTEIMLGSFSLIEE